MVKRQQQSTGRAQGSDSHNNGRNEAESAAANRE
jgi:hypothetical protein